MKRRRSHHSAIYVVVAGEEIPLAVVATMGLDTAVSWTQRHKDHGHSDGMFQGTYLNVGHSSESFALYGAI